MSNSDKDVVLRCAGGSAEPGTALLRRSLMSLLTCIGLMNCVCLAVAQDMRIYTTVSSIGDSTAKAQLLSHSLTLFHAGKVYDFMEDIGEVVILDTARHRFVILGGNYAATEVSFAEVHQFLESAKVKSDEYLAEVVSQGDDAKLRRAQALAFQLKPTLKKNYSSENGLLTLQGEFLSYRVETAVGEDPQFLARYLEYADWAARLNYVLHPHAAYPAARIQLDEELRHLGRLPTTVELSASLEHPVKLRAKHEFRELQAIDRQLINRWEQQLRSSQTRWVTFHDYQQRLLAGKTR